MQDDRGHDVNEEGDYFFAGISLGLRVGAQGMKYEGVSPGDDGPCDGSVCETVCRDEEKCRGWEEPQKQDELSLANSKKGCPSKLTQ